MADGYTIEEIVNGTGEVKTVCTEAINLPDKATPVDADIVVIANTESSNAPNKLTLANLKAFIMGTKFAPWILDVFSTAGVLFGGNDSGFCYIGADGAITATETNSQVRMPKGKVVAITGNCYNASSEGTLTVRKDGLDTGVTGTIIATGQFRITGTSEDFDGTELLSFAYSTGAGGGFGVRGLQVEHQSEVI